MIVRVRLKRDIDRDGDPIIWVKIVVTRGFMALDPKRTIPFGPLLRTKLWDIEEPAAPVLIYVVEDEDRDFDAAAA